MKDNNNIISEEEMLRQIAGGEDYPVDLPIMVTDQRPHRNFYGYVKVSGKWPAETMKKAIAYAINDLVKNFKLIKLSDLKEVDYNTTVEGNGIKPGDFIRVVDARK